MSVSGFFHSCCARALGGELLGTDVASRMHLLAMLGHDDDDNAGTTKRDVAKHCTHCTDTVDTQLHLADFASFFVGRFVGGVVVLLYAMVTTS